MDNYFFNSNYKDGKRHGSYKEWYSNGQLLSEYTYKEDELS